MNRHIQVISSFLCYLFPSYLSWEELFSRFIFTYSIFGFLYAARIIFWKEDISILENILGKPFLPAVYVGMGLIGLFTGNWKNPVFVKGMSSRRSIPYYMTYIGLLYGNLLLGTSITLVMIVLAFAAAVIVIVELYLRASLRNNIKYYSRKLAMLPTKSLKWIFKIHLLL